MKTRISITNVTGFAALGVTGAIGLLLPWSLPGATASPPDTLVIRGVVRDFRSSHADFAVYPSDVADHVAGNVALALGVDGRPVAATHSSTEVTVTADTVAGWGFDEGSGLTASDATGTHHGILKNGASWVNGKVGTAVLLDGVDDFVEVPHHPDFMVDEVTVSFWFNSEDPVPQQGMVSRDSLDFDNGGHFTFFVKDNKCRIRLQSTTASYWVESAAGSVQPDTWYHVTFSFGPGGMRMYLDDVLVDSDPYTGGLGSTSGGPGNTEPWTFGVNSWVTDESSSNGWIEPFRGMLDELQIYREQLTHTDVTRLAGSKVLPAWRDDAANAIAPHLAGMSGGAPCVTVADTSGSLAGDSSGGISSQDSFRQWYREARGTNLSIGRSITLTRNAGVYEFLTDSFYPIDGQLFGNDGDAHNNYFTYSFDMVFTYDECAGQFLEFEGGNGTWIFIDRKLVMDLGGVSPNVEQHVEMDRLGLTDGEEYHVRFFYSHRVAGSAEFRLRTNVALGAGPAYTVSAGFD